MCQPFLECKITFFVHDRITNKFDKETKIIDFFCIFALNKLNEFD